MHEFSRKLDQVFETLGCDGGTLLIVPPFADLYQASLAVHLLQACARRAGFGVRVLYTNLLFASLIGERAYNAICQSTACWMWGERIFAARAFDMPPFGRADRLKSQVESDSVLIESGITLEALCEIESLTERFCSELAIHFAESSFTIAGVFTTYYQTAASIALLRAIKAVRPRVLGLIGGANCQGKLADGIASLRGPIDYVFSGECETCFPEFLRRASSGDLPRERIVRGEMCLDMDSLPEPSYDDYFTQLDVALPSWREYANVWISYETSRGCWWGAKQHCTFCGLNGEAMEYRAKSPDRAVAGVRRLVETYPTRLICMTDNILPFSYFRTVLPELAKINPPAHIFYETKANLSLDQVDLLAQAGVGVFQPGIEALSSSLLRLLKKGVLARQNVALLRYARAARLAVNWNVLFDIPGDTAAEYESTTELMPLLHHLNPPAGFCGITIDRFSPYFRFPEEYCIQEVRPFEAYSWAFPEGADIGNLAYHFEGDFQSAVRSFPGVLSALKAACETWQAAWNSSEHAPPVLELTPMGEERFLLMDTRGPAGTSELQFLTIEQARAVLVGKPIDKQPLAAWAIERKLAVALDGWCVPLVVAPVEILKAFEASLPTVATDLSASVNLVQLGM